MKQQYRWILLRVNLNSILSYMKHALVKNVSWCISSIQKMLTVRVCLRFYRVECYVCGFRKVSTCNLWLPGTSDLLTVVWRLLRIGRSSCPFSIFFNIPCFVFVTYAFACIKKVLRHRPWVLLKISVLELQWQQCTGWSTLVWNCSFL